MEIMLNQLHPTSVNFNKSGIKKLPNDKPVIYKIKTRENRANSKKGRVRERLKEHLKQGNIPGAKTHIKRHFSIRDAQRKESRSIKQTKPKYNKRGK